MSALKQLLKDHNVNQNTLSKPMCVSVSAVNLFVNHGQRPKKNPEQFQAKIIGLLEAKGMRVKLAGG